MLTIGKPKSLGAGLKRIVRCAGGKKGKLIANTNQEASKILSPSGIVRCTTDGILTRKYTNGVTLKYSANANANIERNNGSTWSSPFWLGGDLLGVFKDGRLKYAQNTAAGFKNSDSGEIPIVYKTRADVFKKQNRTFFESVMEYFEKFNMQ